MRPPKALHAFLLRLAEAYTNLIASGTNGAGQNHACHVLRWGRQRSELLTSRWIWAFKRC